MSRKHKEDETAVQPPRDCLRVYNNRLIPTDICDLWRNPAGNDAAFLVLGGPSLLRYPKEVFAERGVLSLAVNNAAAFLPVTAWTCSDPCEKMNHALFYDAKMLTFIPRNKASAGRGRLRVKTGIGEEARFDWSPIIARDCPNVFFFDRSEQFDPANFFGTSATWGTNRKANAITGRDRLLFTPFLALRLLFHIGIRETYCLGLDFGMSSDAKYAFPQDRTTDAIRSNNNLYKTANRELRALKPYLDKAGFMVYNCAPTSGCDVFPHVDFDTALERVRGAVPKGELDCSLWYESKGLTGSIPEIRQQIAAKKE